MPTPFFAGYIVSLVQGCYKPTYNRGVWCCSGYTINTYSWFIQLIDIFQCSPNCMISHLQYRAGVPSFICILPVAKPPPSMQYMLPSMIEQMPAAVNCDFNFWLPSTARAGWPDNDGDTERERELRHLGSAIIDSNLWIGTCTCSPLYQRRCHKTVSTS